MMSLFFLTDICYDVIIATAPSLTEVPFQVAIKFTRSNGMQVLRVLSQMKPVTSDVSLAEKDLNVAICAATAAQVIEDFKF